MSSQIELKIDGRRLTPEKFLSGASEFIALVQGVTKNVTTTQIEWVVELDKGSAIVRMRAENPSQESEKSVDAICQGVRALRNGVKTIPFGFKRENITSAKIIAALNDGQEIQNVFIQDGGSPEPVPHGIVQTADAILEGHAHAAFGSIEGRIVSLSAKHGYVCVIDDPVRRREVTCYLQSPQAQKQAIEGYTKRVMAKGLIHYAKEGYAVNITVDDIRIFPPDSDLPTLKDVQEIYKLYK
jgi:hypothetical protein